MYHDIPDILVQSEYFPIKVMLTLKWHHILSYTTDRLKINNFNKIATIQIAQHGN